MKYCPVENFNQLAQAIQRIEEHIGVLTSLDPSTIRGQLNTSFQGYLYDSNNYKIAMVKDGLIIESYTAGYYMLVEDGIELLCEDGSNLLT